MNKPERKLVAVRVDPDVWHLGRIAAVTAKKTMGQWLEDAIREKVQTRSNSNVIETNS